jgi:hypothetical protein
VLAPQLVILCGSKQLHWDDFAEGVMLWKRAKSSNRQLASQLLKKASRGHNALLLQRQETFAERLLHIRDYLSQKRAADEDISLEELILLFSWMDSPKARDAIYAFTSLAWGAAKDSLRDRLNLSSDGSIFVNEALSDKTIFMRFVARCIQGSGSLDILCRSWAPENSKNLPTWIRKVPGPHRVVRVSFVSDTGLGKQPYSASAAMYPSYHFSDRAKSHVPDAISELSKRKRRLLVRTLILDEVANLDRVSSLHSLIVEGMWLGTITKMSARISQGVITRECLELGGLKYSSDKSRWTSNDIPSPLWRTLVADRTAQGEQPPPWFPKVIASCLNDSLEGDLITGTAGEADDSPSAISEVLQRIRDVTWNRTLFRSVDNIVGLGPADAVEEDYICILIGCSVPVILRRVGLNWLFIGECFVFGFMDGEAMTRVLKPGAMLRESPPEEAVLALSSTSTEVKGGTTQSTREISELMGSKREQLALDASEIPFSFRLV